MDNQIKPFASLAQARRVESLVKEGKVTQKTFDDSLMATTYLGQLPEHVKPKQYDSIGAEMADRADLTSVYNRLTERQDYLHKLTAEERDALYPAPAPVAQVDPVPALEASLSAHGSVILVDGLPPDDYFRENLRRTAEKLNALQREGKILGYRLDHHPVTMSRETASTRITLAMKDRPAIWAEELFTGDALKAVLSQLEEVARA